jgi:hypothetical protein
MALPVQVGQELLAVPFPEMVFKLASAISESQLALDMNSIEVARVLANTTLPEGSVVVAMEEKIDADGNVIESKPVFNNKELPLIAFGLTPTFYAFTETVIEVKMEISMRLERTFERSTSRTFKFENKTELETSAGGGFNFLGLAKASASAKFKNTTTVAYTSTVNTKYTNKFSVKVDGASLLRTTLQPLPPPERSIPQVRVIEGGTP